jgi:hypothetical protein
MGMRIIYHDVPGPEAFEEMHEVLDTMHTRYPRERRRPGFAGAVAFAGGTWKWLAYYTKTALVIRCEGEVQT